MKQTKLFKKADIIVIAAALITAAVFFALFYFGKSESGKLLMITTESGKEYLDMTVDGVYDFETEYGINRVEIKDGVASVIYSDCKNQICVNSAEISEIGDTICCLPHRFAITIIKKHEQ